MGTEKLTIPEAIPETVVVPGELVIDVLATIDQFRRRLYVLNGSHDTDETDAIGKSLFELFTRFFKPIFGRMDYWDESGNAPNVLWQAIEDRSEELTAEWFAQIAKYAPVAEAVA